MSATRRRRRSPGSASRRVSSARPRRCSRRPPRATTAAARSHSRSRTPRLRAAARTSPSSRARGRPRTGAATPAPRARRSRSWTTRRRRSGRSPGPRGGTAADWGGNASTASQVIHGVDLTARVISALPDPSTIECPATPSFASPSATDACDPSPTLESKDVTTPGSCVGQYSVTRTWTAKDACGNTSTASQTINVVDLTAPVIAALPDPSTIECPATPSFATASATDACDPSPRLESKDVTTPGTCAGQYSVTRTWTATDACGNASTASQTIRVVDTTGPVVTCPADITIGVCQNPVPFEIKAEDACGGPVTVVATPPSGSTFAVGNETPASSHVHVLDNPIGEIAGPVAACPGESVTLVGPAGFNYLWGTGATSQSIVVNTAGTYTLTIFERVTGCPANLSHPFTRSKIV